MKKSSLGKITLLALGSILALSMFAACSSDSGSTSTSTDEARRSSSYTDGYYNDYNGYDDSLTNTNDQNGYVNGSPFNSSDSMTYDMEDFSSDVERTWDDVVDGIEGNMGGNYGTTNSEMLNGSNYTTNGTDYETTTMK